MCRRPSSFWAPIAARWHRGVTSQSTMSTPIPYGRKSAPRNLVSIDSNGVFDEPKFVALFSCVRPVAASHTKEILYQGCCLQLAFLQALTFPGPRGNTAANRTTLIESYCTTTSVMFLRYTGASKVRLNRFRLEPFSSSLLLQP